MLFFVSSFCYLLLCYLCFFFLSPSLMLFFVSSFYHCLFLSFLMLFFVSSFYHFLILSFLYVMLFFVSSFYHFLFLSFLMLFLMLFFVSSFYHLLLCYSLFVIIISLSLSVFPYVILCFFLLSPSLMLFFVFIAMLQLRAFILAKHAKISHFDLECFGLGIFASKSVVALVTSMKHRGQAPVWLFFLACLDDSVNAPIHLDVRRMS